MEPSKKCPNCKAVMPEEHDICWNCNYDLIGQKVLPKIGSPKAPGDYDKDWTTKAINCLRCDVPLVFNGNFKFHEGTKWGILGDLGHLFTNRASFDVYVCPNCMKVEFYLPEG